MLGRKGQALETQRLQSVGSWQMSTCTHVFFGLPCTRYFKVKQTWLLVGGWIIRNLPPIGSIHLQGKLRKFYFKRTYAFWFVSVPSGFNQLTPSPLTHAMSVVLVGIGACDCWLCQGSLRLKSQKCKPGSGEMEDAVQRGRNQLELGDKGLEMYSCVHISTCVNCGLKGVCFLICKMYVLGGSSFRAQGKSVSHLGFSFLCVLKKKKKMHNWWLIKPGWFRESLALHGPVKKWNIAHEAEKKFDTHKGSNFEKGLTCDAGFANYL